jgi:peptidoglycan hydrolase-like protein with peptidoglycan-binding domain
MRLILSLTMAALCLVVPAYAQSAGSATSGTTTTASGGSKAIFRPIADQITEAQVLLKQKGLFNGEATGKYSNEFRAAIKVFQGENGLRKTGTLNRATLEAMKIPLTEYQKGIPVTPNSYANAPASTKSTGPRRVIFRATKAQITEAQKFLRGKGMYAGEFTGKLSNETRAGLRKFQAEAGIKVTGTLNRVTLEAMGIPLTEKQLADKAAEAR